MVRTYFITGTDTDVGKTLVARTLLQAFAARGIVCAGYKPISAGCARTPEGLRNLDAQQLQAAASLPLPIDSVNPYAFEPPIAPHIAAREVGETIPFAGLSAGLREIERAGAERVIVEGAGGWFLPLDHQHLLSDWVALERLPVILVVGVRLGCISHALLTAEAIAQDGLQLAGWVANIIDPRTSRLEENLATLAERLPAPCLGRVPKLKSPTAEAVAQYLQLDLLD